MNTIWWKRVCGLDKNMKRGPEANCAAMLLCAAEHGANVERVIELTGVSTSSAYEIEERLRKNGIWVGEMTHHSGWTDEGELGAIGFWCDVCVGVGFMTRAKKRRKPKSGKYGAAA